MKLLVHLILFIALTIVTQIGGLVYLLVILIAKLKRLPILGSFLLFCSIYLVTIFTIVPWVSSKVFGRVKIENNQLVSYHNVLTVLCNRNYVKPELNNALKEIGYQLNKKHPNTKVIYLDANFPFFDGFPLFPHLSHNDGKKVDISFIYKDASGKITNNKPSNSGYGVFENPTQHETNTTAICKEKGYWQYDYPKYLTLGTNNKSLTFSNKVNKDFLEIITNLQQTQKVFIEPHLKTRLHLKSSKIRFQGCKAVRHDDHIHLQIN
ncbi:hypothetical protein [Tenacibaculum sp. L6]|uniref:hypothetical protein n=1 Tax=Tenacibaculum sp. L6 TaxID=2992764 RepID=UPI00237BD551|nr:hypothetical protein [Tenacibaculum sp. L6]MDE0536284.1 hypothetical protein [Tenacibaculum sp. L6]